MWRVPSRALYLGSRLRGGGALVGFAKAMMENGGETLTNMVMLDVFFWIYSGFRLIYDSYKLAELSWLTRVYGSNN